jgi:hypothetical protein
VTSCGEPKNKREMSFAVFVSFFGVKTQKLESLEQNSMLLL